MKLATQWRRALGVAAGLIALLAIGGAALSQPIPEFRFYGFSGSVTINGEPAPAGTVIIAWIGGEEAGRGTVDSAGSWWVDVASHSEGVTFTVGGREAGAGPFEARPASGARRINLRIGADTPAAGELEPEDAGGDELRLESEDDAGSMEPERPAAGSGGLADENFPVGGSGGLADDGAASWPIAAGVTAAVMAALAGAALLAGRRTGRIYS